MADPTESALREPGGGADIEPSLSKASTRTRHLEIWLPVVIVALDQLTKAIVRANIPIYSSVTIVPDLLNFTLVPNTGDPTNGLFLSGHGIAKTTYTWPNLGIAPRFGVDVPVMAGKEAGQAVMDHTHGEGVDYLVEAVGNQEALAQSIGLIREAGNGLYFGLPDTKELVPFNFHDFQRKRLTINAITHALRDRSMTSFQRALDLIVTNQIDVSPLISHAFSLDQIEQAMDYATTYKDNARKVCLKF